MTISFEEFGLGGITIIWVYLLLLGIVGTVTNGMIIYLFAVTKTLRTPMNSLFLSVTVGDLMVSLFGTMVSAIFTAAQTSMSQAVCEIYGFITFLGGSADGIGLTVIAVERYLTVARPFNVGNISYTRAGLWLAYTWIMAALCAGLPLVGLSKYTGEGAGTWCSIDWQVKNLLTDIYIVFIFIMDYFLPIVIIVVCYYFVVAKVAEVAKAGASASSLKAQKAVTMQAVAMIVGYIVAWTPYAVVCLVVSITGKDVFGPQLATLPPLFAKSSFVYNPFIYVGLNKQFRQAFITKVLRGYNPFQKSPKVDQEKGVVMESSNNATQGIGLTTAGVENQAAEVPTVAKSVDTQGEPSIAQKMSGDAAKVAPKPSL